MKNLFILLLTSFLFFSCEKQAQEITPVVTSVVERKPDPMTTGAQVTYTPSTNWNVQWDTTVIGGNYPTTRITWDNQVGASMYYLLIEGTGNGSCPKQVVVNGITYYYPWTYSSTNQEVLLSGQICGTTSGNWYNMIVLYYKFQQGQWYAYTSLPINFPLESRF